MERVFLHRAVLDGVNRAGVRARVILQRLFDEGGDGGFAARGGAQQKQDALADFEAVGGRGEVLDDALDGVVLPVDLLVEQAVSGRAGFGGFVHPLVENGVVHQLVRQARDGRVDGEHFEILGERPLPIEPADLALGVSQELFGAGCGGHGCRRLPVLRADGGCRHRKPEGDDYDGLNEHRPPRHRAERGEGDGEREEQQPADNRQHRRADHEDE